MFEVIQLVSRERISKLEVPLPQIFEDRQENVASSSGRVQQRTAEQIVHVSVPQVQEEMCRSRRKRILERICQHLVDAPVPHVV